MTGVMTITGLSQLSSRNPPRLEAVNTCPSNPVFNPLAIELKLYRRLRADETHTLTKFDHYPIIRTEVRQSSVRVGDAAETSGRRRGGTVDRWSRGNFFNIVAIALRFWP